MLFQYRVAISTAASFAGALVGALLVGLSLKNLIDQSGASAPLSDSKLNRNHDLSQDESADQGVQP